MQHKARQIHAYHVLIVLGLFIFTIGITNKVMQEQADKRIAAVELWPTVTAKVAGRPFYGSLGHPVGGEQTFTSPMVNYWYDYQGGHYPGRSPIGYYTKDIDQANTVIAASQLQHGDVIQIHVNPHNGHESYFDPQYLRMPRSGNYRFVVAAGLLMIGVGILQWRSAPTVGSALIYKKRKEDNG